MKIIFAGTPDFAAQALIALLHHTSHQVALVLTQPDRPAGRGMKLSPNPVKEVALLNHLPIYQPLTLRTDEAQQTLYATQADLMIVAAYGRILPPAILSIPLQGCINIHASLLPRWRGAAPIQRAIQAGDTQTGITIMQMDTGLDTGDILLTCPVPITEQDTAGSLLNKLALCGAQAIVNTLDNLPYYYKNRQPQSTVGITYAEKLQKEEARLDWRSSAETLVKQIRAFNPFPGAYTFYQGQIIKLWQATIVEATGRPGEILAANNNGIIIACQSQAVCIQRLQRPGSKQMEAAHFLAGFPLAVGQIFN